MKVLVIGCGSIGSRHIRNLLEMGHIVWGQDTEWNKIPKGAMNFAYVDDLDIIDVVFICTPPSTHAHFIKFWNGKYLFIEKPLCRTLEELEEIEKIKFGKINMVACNMRFEPLIEQAYELLQELGRLDSVKVDFGYHLADWRPNIDYREVEHPGIVLDCFHDLDILRYFHGEPCVSKVHGNHIQFEGEPLLSSINALMVFGGGLVGNMHLDYHRIEKRRRIEWIGYKGTMTYVEDRSLKNPEGINCLYFNGEEYYNQYDHNYPYKKQLEHFFYCIETGIQTCNPIEEAIKTMEFAFELEGR